MGCQRSGTTLTGLVIGSHPSCLFIDEDEGAADLLEEYINAVQQGVAPLRVEYLNLRAKKKYRYQDDRDTFHRATYPVLKCLNQVYDYLRIFENLPAAKVIWLARDVRDVICSMRRIDHPIEQKQVNRILSNPHITELYREETTALSKLEGKDHLRKALVWKIKTSLMEQAKLLCESVYVLRYEDLVKAPQETIENLFTYLAIPMDSAALEHYKAYNEGMAIGHTKRNAPIKQTSIGRWESELTQKEQSEVWELVGEYMGRLGYRIDGALSQSTEIL
jgi:hypothetical protein